MRLAAQGAAEAKISVEHVRAAARRWYVTVKEKAVAASPEAAELLHFVVDKVIGERRARAFLLRQEESHARLIVDLYDARVLHVIKHGVSTHDEPGVRYDVYQLDFGAYVELIATARAVQGLFQAVANASGASNAGEWVEVPVDDYRSIRRAILDLREFETRQLTLDTLLPRM